MNFTPIISNYSQYIQNNIHDQYTIHRISPNKLSRIPEHWQMVTKYKLFLPRSVHIMYTFAAVCSAGLLGQNKYLTLNKLILIVF